MDGSDALITQRSLVQIQPPQPRRDKGLAVAAADPFVVSATDFLLGPKDSNGKDTYVLCEINVSSVSPFPESALSEIAKATHARTDRIVAGNKAGNR